MNIVLDTNVFISAVLWTGLPHEALKLIFASFQLVQSPETLVELENVLKRKKFQEILLKRNLDVGTIMKSLLMQCEVYTVSANTKRKMNTISIDDTDDLIFIGLALEAHAKYIVSGDEHLLKLKRTFDIDILTVQQFLGKSKS
ncbi:MAG: putative toxin-antitoxin system toxin component, PIN family [Lentisphaerae bacterium GWF2_44_16]|nr:MAG: putative toxin-antitoxin system toxin component, PIN family [Lentisphaerae bacterium GWF2_44_16]